MTASPPLPAPNFPEVYLTGIIRSQHKKKVEVKDNNAECPTVPGNSSYSGRSDHDSNIQTAV